MADKKKRIDRDTEAEVEPGFFSDYGYGNGTALIITHDPTKPKGGSPGKTAKNSKKKNK